MNRKKERLDQELEQWLADFYEKGRPVQKKREKDVKPGKKGREQGVQNLQASRRKDQQKPGKVNQQNPKSTNQQGQSQQKQKEKAQMQREGMVLGDGTASKAEPICPVSARCGGCQLLHLSYEEQLRQKNKRLTELLKGICPVHSIIGMEQPWHYRNKVHAVFDHDQKGNPISGVYEANSHRVVPVETCRIEDEKADEIIGTIRGMLKSFKIRTFDEDTGYGLLRHVLVRVGKASGQIMVVLVTASPVFPSKNNFVKALRSRHPEITTIIQNVNDRNTSMVLGDRESVLYGRGYIEDQLCGYTFRISSKSFYQVNPVQTEKLYQKAIELAGLSGRETVVDAYCGIGTIGIIAAASAKRVIGVELNPDAVRDAVKNAKRNQVENIEFYCNDASVFLTQMAEAEEPVDVVIMDPPRSGSTEIFMDAVGRIKPEKVIYISCGPESLARDLKYFKKMGYQAEGAWGYDMFSQTYHVETVALLTRKAR